MSVAYFTPPSNPQPVQAAITHTTALVTRGDVMSTSDYFKHRESQGHLPKRIKQVNTNLKQLLLSDSGLPVNNAQC